MQPPKHTIEIGNFFHVLAHCVLLLYQEYRVIILTCTIISYIVTEKNQNLFKEKNFGRHEPPTCNKKVEVKLRLTIVSD